MGFQKDISKVMNGFDVLIHASVRPEPFGRVILEAFACEIPVVAAAAGGVLELVRDGETGLLFKPGDVLAMADQVRKIFEVPGLAARLTANAKKLFMNNFTIETHVAQVAELLASHVQSVGP